MPRQLIYAFIVETHTGKYNNKMFPNEKFVTIINGYQQQFYLPE